MKVVCQVAFYFTALLAVTCVVLMLVCALTGDAGHAVYFGALAAFNTVFAFVWRTNIDLAREMDS